MTAAFFLALFFVLIYLLTGVIYRWAHHDAEQPRDNTVREQIEIIPDEAAEEQAYAVMTRNNDSISIECCYVSDDGSFTQETYNSLAIAVFPASVVAGLTGKRPAALAAWSFLCTA